MKGNGGGEASTKAKANARPRSLAPANSHQNKKKFGVGIHDGVGQLLGAALSLLLPRGGGRGCSAALQARVHHQVRRHPQESLGRLLPSCACVADTSQS